MRATVTGGPILEQFINSYNRIFRTSSMTTVKEIFIAKREAMDDGLEGYYLGTSEKTETYMIEGLNTTEIENLYTITDDTKAYTYWLGSPSAYDTDCVISVDYDGIVNYYTGMSDGNIYGDYEDSDVGLRPLICLPSEVILVEQENGTYNIQYSF